MAKPEKTWESEDGVGWGAVRRRLPAGRHAFAAGVVRSQRDRMLDAIAQTCAAEGYGAATVEAITARGVLPADAL